MPTITTDDGCRLHVEIEGPEKAPVLMLCNSLGTDLSMWDDQAAAFARHHRLVRYDRRGHGKSDAPASPYSMDRLGQDAIAIMNALGLTRVHYCGLSLGGMTGMWLARHAPDRLTKVVLANTAAAMPQAPWNDRIRTVKTKGMSALIDSVLERWFTPGFRARAPQAIARTRRMLETTPPLGYAGCCAAIRDMDQRWGLRTIKTPTLVIVGAHDPSTTPAAGEAIRTTIPGAQMASIDAAHMSNMEQPAAFADAVLRFLAA